LFSNWILSYGTDPTFVLLFNNPNIFITYRYEQFFLIVGPWELDAQSLHRPKSLYIKEYRFGFAICCEAWLCLAVRERNWFWASPLDVFYS